RRPAVAGAVGLLTGRAARGSLAAAGRRTAAAARAGSGRTAAGAGRGGRRFLRGVFRGAGRARGAARGTGRAGGGRGARAGGTGRAGRRAVRRTGRARRTARTARAGRAGADAAFKRDGQGVADYLAVVVGDGGVDRIGLVGQQGVHDEGDGGPAGGLLRLYAVDVPVQIFRLGVLAAEPGGKGIVHPQDARA